MFGLTEMQAQIAWKVGVSDFILMNEWSVLKLSFFCGLGEGKTVSLTLTSGDRTLTKTCRSPARIVYEMD